MNKNATITYLIIYFFFCFYIDCLSYINPEINLKSNNERRADNSYEISYSIEPFYDIKIFRFIVVFEFRGDKSGETAITLPYEFGGQRVDRGIKFLKALSNDTYLVDTEKPDKKIIKHPPNSLIKIYYQVEEIREDDLELGNHYMPILNRSYFHFLGETFFIVPSDESGSDYKIKIMWNHIPANWNLANSFGINEKIQDLKLPLWKFRYAVFTGGDYRILKRNVGDNPVYLSIRGKWNFPDDQLIELVKNIVRTERDFWKDHNFPFYLLTVIPIDGSEEQGGTGRTNSYALFLSDDRTIDFRLKRLIAHETFHTWLGEKMKFAEPEQLVYWFKEGFCDYYTRLLLLRSKQITLDEYLSDFNKILSAYFTSPVRYEKNERVVNEFWTDQNIMKLPYLRGDIIAHNLNASIKKNTNRNKSLDDLMHDLYKRCKDESLVISTGSLSAIIRFYTGDQSLSNIMMTLNSGAALKVNSEALGPCFIMEMDTYRKFFLIGEEFEVPVFKYRSENQSKNNKNCLDWFGAN